MLMYKIFLHLLGYDPPSAPKIESLQNGVFHEMAAPDLGKVNPVEEVPQSLAVSQPLVENPTTIADEVTEAPEVRPPAPSPPAFDLRTLAPEPDQELGEIPATTEHTGEYSPDSQSPENGDAGSPDINPDALIEEGPETFFQNISSAFVNPDGEEGKTDGINLACKLFQDTML